MSHQVHQPHTAQVHCASASTLRECRKLALWQALKVSKGGLQTHLEKYELTKNRIHAIADDLEQELAKVSVPSTQAECREWLAPGD